MYKYETHMHTYPVSLCAKVSVREALEFYKKMEYDGVFITNHFINSNDHNYVGKSFEEKVDFYCSAYEEGLEIGKEIGIKVFFGFEFTHKGTDFLVYGINKDWILNHPEFMELKTNEKLDLLKESGALIIQAHPFREASYISHIRLFPRKIDGVEIINACRTDDENAMAKLYADHYSLINFAGSDNHTASNQKQLAGVCFDEPIESTEDFINKVKTGKAQIFTMVNE